MHTRYLEATDRKQPSLKNISITSISKDMEAGGDVRISFLLSILKSNRQNFTKFYAFILARSSSGLLCIIVFTFVSELGLNICQNFI